MAMWNPWPERLRHVSPLRRIRHVTPKRFQVWPYRRVRDRTV